MPDVQGGSTQHCTQSMIPNCTNARKIEHLNVLQQDEQIDRCKRYFERIHLRHRALPEVDFAAINTATTFLGKPVSFPLLISSMTGGEHELTERINRHLALAAEATGVAMGVGSQRVMFTHPESRRSFAVRQYAPNALLFANLGAVQLNYGFDLAHCRQAIDALAADALFLHLNPLQEVVQPEGNTNFSGLAERIGQIAKVLKQPVVIKEVGAGLSHADVEQLLTHGLQYFDIAGSGGTSWSRLEHYRDDSTGGRTLGLTFQDWGIPTPVALDQLSPLGNRVTLIASGGIRNGIDMVKALILGGQLCGVAAPFVEPAMQSADAVIRTIERLRLEFTTTMFLLGIAKISDLIGNRRLILDWPTV